MGSPIHGSMSSMHGSAEGKVGKHVSNQPFKPVPCMELASGSPFHPLTAPWTGKKEKV